MKIVIDTVTKQAICPPDFFSDIDKINQASTLTGRKEEIQAKEYLNKILEECSKTIVNKSNVKKQGRTRTKAVAGEIVISPKK